MQKIKSGFVGVLSTTNFVLTKELFHDLQAQCSMLPSHNKVHNQEYTQFETIFCRLSHDSKKISDEERKMCITFIAYNNQCM